MRMEVTIASGELTPGMALAVGPDEFAPPAILAIEPDEGTRRMILSIHPYEVPLGMILAVLSQEPSARMMFSGDTHRFRHIGTPLDNYWHASQSGLSMEQNFASSTVASLAAPIAPTPPDAVTAFSSPPLPVDFSAEVAARVRR